jgi:hypothetical protein
VVNDRDQHAVLLGDVASKHHRRAHLHVAIALEIAADGFLSFDDEQNALAEAAGLSLIRLRAGTD